MVHLLTQYSKDAPTNPRGIPYAPFVDKVEDYVSSRAEVDGTMKSFQEMISYVSPLEDLAAQAEHLLQSENTNSWRPTHKGGRQALMRRFLISRRPWRQSNF